jgi:hypothetical protein
MVERRGLSTLDTIHDQDLALYRAFGLRKGGLRQLAGPKVVARGVMAALVGKHGIGPILGDVRQLAGVFLIHKCAVVRSFRHRTAADRPDYAAIASVQQD